MAMMAHPPTVKLKHLVSSTHLIGHVPFDASDLTNSATIYGTDSGMICGKTVKMMPSMVRPMVVTIPLTLLEHLRDVTLVADVMFVNGLPFL